MRSLLEIHQSRHLWSYIQIARVDHWFKNVFMLLGVLLAFFYEPALSTWDEYPPGRYTPCLPRV